MKDYLYDVDKTQFNFLIIFLVLNFFLQSVSKSKFLLSGIRSLISLFFSYRQVVFMQINYGHQRPCCYSNTKQNKPITRRYSLVG